MTQSHLAPGLDDQMDVMVLNREMDDAEPPVVGVTRERVAEVEGLAGLPLWIPRASRAGPTALTLPLGRHRGASADRQRTRLGLWKRRGSEERLPFVAGFAGRALLISGGWRILADSNLTSFTVTVTNETWKLAQ